MKNLIRTMIAAAALFAMQFSYAQGISFPPATPNGIKALTLALGNRCLNSVNSFGRAVNVSVDVRDAGFTDEAHRTFITTMRYEGPQGDTNCGEAVIVDLDGDILWGYGSGNGNWGVTMKDAKKNFIKFEDIQPLIDQYHLRDSKLD
jgi:hypothetical protein